MHTNYFFGLPHSILRYFSDKSIIKFVSSQDSYCNTKSQSVFVSFTTHTTRPLLKLRHFVLLVMYSWLKGFCCKMSNKYSNLALL